MITLKLLAFPFVAALTLAVAVLSFLTSVADWICGVLSGLFALCALFVWLIQGDAAGGIQRLIVAFCVSPFVLPALAGLLVGMLNELNCSLRDFIIG